MKHVLILIAAHCEPEVLKYTLGTWLEHYDGSYKATVAVSIQSNYDRFSDRRALIEEMAPPLRIVFLNAPDFPEHRMRFSLIHATCLRHLLHRCGDVPCTHVAFLDHDLEFKSDFIGWAMEQDVDWVVSLFEDRKKMLFLEKDRTHWMPKPSIWHTVVSRRLLDKLMEDTNVILPDVVSGNLIYDTAAKMLEYATSEWKMNVRVFPSTVFEEQVRHLWSLSFQYGPTTEGYHEKLRELQCRYRERFPDGISHLLARIQEVPSGVSP